MYPVQTAPQNPMRTAARRLAETITRSSVIAASNPTGNDPITLTAIVPYGNVGPEKR